MASYNNNFYAEGSIFDSAIEAVHGRMNAAIGYAESAFREAFRAISALQDIGRGLIPKNINITPTTPPPFSGNFGNIQAPSSRSIDMTIPNMPSPPDLLPLIEFGNVTFPHFDIPMPSIDLPDIPDVVMPDTLPDPPELQQAPIPSEPDITWPSPPSLNIPNIPEIPHPEFPAFDAKAPDVSKLVPPETTIISGDTDLTKIEGLKEAIENLLNPDRPAYSEEIENAIYLRESERALQAHRDSIDRVCAEWAKRRAPLPDGVLAAMLQELELNYTLKRYDTSRDIAIKNFELTQQKILHAIEAGVNLQNIYFTAENMIAQRVFEASRASAEAMIASYNAGVKKYELMLDAFKTEASVYESKIRGEMLKAEYYKQLIESGKLIADTNESFLKLYIAQINGIEALVNVYKAKMEGARIFSDIQRLRLDAYRTQIEAFIASVNAKTAEFDMYKAKISGEVAKVEAFSKQVDAYRSEVQAKATELNGYIEQMKGYTEINKNLTSQYVANVDAIRTMIQAEATRVDAIIKTYMGEVEVYKSQIQAESIKADVNIRVYEAEIKRILAQYEMNLKSAELEIKNYEVMGQLRIEAMKGVAQVASSLALGALSSLHVSASIGASGSAGSSRARVESIDTNFNYNYDMPTPTE